MVRAMKRTQSPDVRGEEEKARVRVRERLTMAEARRYIYRKRDETIL